MGHRAASNRAATYRAASAHGHPAAAMAMTALSQGRTRKSCQKECRRTQEFHFIHRRTPSTLMCDNERTVRYFAHESVKRITLY